MKNTIIIFINLMLIAILGVAQDCLPVTNLQVEYTQNCDAAKITWNAPSKSITAPLNPSVERSAVHVDAEKTTRASANVPQQTESVTAVNFLNPAKGANSEIIYKMRQELGSTVYKATLSSFPGTQIGSVNFSVQAMEYVDGTVYGVNYSSGNSFGKINMTNGAWTTIKQNCGYDAVSLCYNPTNGLTYITQWNGGPVGHVDLVTGNFTQTSTLPVGGDYTYYMAIDNDGDAYVIKNLTGDFGKFNVSTGVFTYINTLTFTPAQIQNLGVDRETNELYWIAHTTGNTSSNVYKINKTNGTLSEVATISTRVESFAIITSPPEPCNAVSNLTHTVAENTVTLNWTAAEGNPTGYQISFDGTILTTVTTTTYTHTNVTEGLHSYGVIALFDDSCLPFGIFQTVIVGDFCQYKIEMFDSGSNGWGNGTSDVEFSSVKIYQGTTLLAECTVPYDTYTATAYPLLPVGEIKFSWFEGNNGNNDDWECSFKIFNYDDELIYEAQEGEVSNGVFLTHNNDCGINNPIRYNVYRDDEPIAQNISATSLTDTEFVPTEDHIWSVKVICEEGESELVEKKLEKCDAGQNLNETELMIFNIVPNPAIDHIMIYASADFYAVDVTNFLGQTVISQSNAEKSAQIDVSNLTSGIYFVRIFSDRGTSIKKIVKQ